MGAKKKLNNKQEFVLDSLRGVIFQVEELLKKHVDKPSYGIYIEFPGQGWGVSYGNEETKHAMIKEGSELVQILREGYSIIKEKCKGMPQINLELNRDDTLSNLERLNEYI